MAANRRRNLFHKWHGHIIFETCLNRKGKCIAFVFSFLYVCEHNFKNPTRFVKLSGVELEFVKMKIYLCHSKIPHALSDLDTGVWDLERMRFGRGLESLKWSENPQFGGGVPPWEGGSWMRSGWGLDTPETPDLGSKSRIWGVLGSKSRVSRMVGYPQIPCHSGTLVPAFLGVVDIAYSSPKCPLWGLNLSDVYGEIGLPRTYDRGA